MSRLFLFFLFAGVIPVLLPAQVELSEDFASLLNNAGLSFVEPLEARYKDIRVAPNELSKYSFAIRSNKEKIEIRYHIFPYKEYDPMSYSPHIRAMTTLVNLATNEQEQVMRGMEVSEEDLKENFMADWGKVFFFTPKKSFAENRYCKMLALHRENQGTAFVFFLFDEPGPELDYRFYALQFK